VDGVGVRATCRITGASKGGVLRLIADLGRVCSAYLDVTLRNLPCRVLEVDEIGSFLEMKENGCCPLAPTNGSVTAICAESKLIPAFMIGTRNAGAATEFLQDLAERIPGRVQMTTDGDSMYLPAVEDSFAGRRTPAMAAGSPAGLGRSRILSGYWRCRSGARTSPCGASSGLAFSRRRAYADS
jgi:hypothetical protein